MIKAFLLVIPEPTNEPTESEIRESKEKTDTQRKEIQKEKDNPKLHQNMATRTRREFSPVVLTWRLEPKRKA
jgi:hypothetical protein